MWGGRIIGVEDGGYRALLYQGDILYGEEQEYLRVIFKLVDRRMIKCTVRTDDHKLLKCNCGSHAGRPSRSTFNHLIFTNPAT